jgi:hypothetical protein
MRIVQFDAVKSCAAGARRGGRENAGQHGRQIANSRHVGIGHPLAKSLAKRFKLARTQCAFQLGLTQSGEPGSHAGLIAVGHLQEFSVPRRNV